MGRKGKGMWDDNESGWIDARRKQPAHRRRVLALRPMDNDGYRVGGGQSRAPGSSRGGTDIKGGGASSMRPAIGRHPKISTGGARFPKLLRVLLSSPSRILGDTQLWPPADRDTL